MHNQTQSTSAMRISYPAIPALPLPFPNTKRSAFSPAVLQRLNRIHKSSANSELALLNLSRAYIALAMPGEFNLKTGQLLEALMAAPLGLTKHEILNRLFPEYPVVSPQMQRTLESRADKLLQRARKRYFPYGIHIHWTRNAQRFSALPRDLCG
jgi:hypothetical protein